MRGAQGYGNGASAASELGFGCEREGALERILMDVLPRERGSKLEICKLRMECANW